MPRTSSQNIFLQTVKDKCEEHNVKFILRNTNRVNINNIYVGGYFSKITKKTPELVCATKGPEYESLLVHEFSHLEQWSEPYHIYKKVDKYTDDIDNWIAGKSVKNIEFKIDQIKLLELDCEKRAVKNIRKYELKIDIPTYIQKANCYILFYNYLKETRRWNKVHLIYSKELLKLCPTKFMSESYYSRIPKKIYRKFIELGI